MNSFTYSEHEHDVRLESSLFRIRATWINQALHWSIIILIAQYTLKLIIRQITIKKHLN
jgi:hypothetical protein